jgi:PAS domain-containing protein
LGQSDRSHCCARKQVNQNTSLRLFRTLTSVKQWKKQLRQSQELQQLAVAGAQLGIWSIDLVSGEIYWDARTREIFGVPTDARATLDLAFSLIHPMIGRWPKRPLSGRSTRDRTVLTPRRSVSCVQMARCAGSLRKGTPFLQTRTRYAGGKLVGVVQDITERKEAEQLRREQDPL